MVPKVFEPLKFDCIDWIKLKAFLLILQKEYWEQNLSRIDFPPSPSPSLRKEAKKKMAELFLFYHNKWVSELGLTFHQHIGQRGTGPWFKVSSVTPEKWSIRTRLPQKGWVKLPPPITLTLDKQYLCFTMRWGKKKFFFYYSRTLMARTP